MPSLANAIDRPCTMKIVSLELFSWLHPDFLQVMLDALASITTRLFQSYRDSLNALRYRTEIL